MLIPALLDEVCGLADTKDRNLIICGDFNFPKIDWINCTSFGNFNLTSPFLYVLEHGLEQHVFSATHKHGNTLDLVFSNRAIIALIENFKPLISDHSILLIRLGLLQSLSSVNTKINIYQYSKTDLNMAESCFKVYKKSIKESIKNGVNINGVYDLFVEGLFQVRKCAVPLKVHKKNTDQPPWFSNRIRNALKKTEMLVQ